MPVRFEIDPNPAETQRACFAIARTALPRAQGLLLIFGLYAGAILAAFIVAPTTALQTAMVGIVSVLATALSLQAAGRTRMRRLQAQDPHSREIHFIELTEKGVHTGCSHVDARYPWSDFQKVSENNEFYLFVRPSGIGSFVPKRLVPPERDSELRARIRDWSPDRGAGLAREAQRT